MNERDGDGRDVPLLTSLGEARQALFLERRIEGKLGIADVPVPGSMK